MAQFQGAVYVLVGAMTVGLHSPLLRAGQVESVKVDQWVLPRMPDGKPDLQGVWANNSATPLERPDQLVGRDVLTDFELENLIERAGRLFSNDADDAAFSDSVFEAALGDVTDFTSRDRATGNYNQFWMAERDFDNRTSLIVDPPSGRLPPLTIRARQQNEARQTYLRDHPGDSWTDRRLTERCITYGIPNLSAGYNTYYQIIQTPDYVVMLHEMIHDVRIIPLDNRPHVSDVIRQWHGDARGYWDGDTLVVETTNFSRKSESPGPLYQRVRGSAEDLFLVQRFTRVGPDTIQHELTVNDPANYTASWTAMIPLRRSEDAIYEYGCHEGNYGIEGILSGYRAQEKVAVESEISSR